MICAAAVSRGPETRIAHHLGASVGAVALTAAPNYKPPAAAPTCTKHLKRVGNQLMSLPDKHVGQVAVLIDESVTGPSQVAIGGSEVPRTRRIGSEVPEAAAYLGNQLLNIVSAQRGTAMESRVPALGNGESGDLRERLLQLNVLITHINLPLGKLEQPSQAFFVRAPDANGDFGEYRA
jgi:hypothetical protein